MCRVYTFVGVVIVMRKNGVIVAGIIVIFGVILSVFYWNEIVTLVSATLGLKTERMHNVRYDSRSLTNTGKSLKKSDWKPEWHW